MIDANIAAEATRQFGTVWDILLGVGGLGGGSGVTYMAARWIFSKMEKRIKEAEAKTIELAKQVGKINDRVISRLDENDKRTNQTAIEVQFIQQRCAEHQTSQATSSGRMEGMMQEGFKRIESVIMAQRDEMQKGLSRAHERIDRLQNGSMVKHHDS